MQKCSVLVLLSAYNGEKYIKEQIETIVNQEGVNVSVLVRDDGSKDNTLDILKDIASKFENVHYIAGTNLGFVGSFSELVHYALQKDTVDFYAFADQDDVWYADKLLSSSNLLAGLDVDLPNLACCNSDLISADKQKIGIFKKVSTRFTRGNTLYYGSFQGCSMLFNHKALEIYDKYRPTDIYHDRWMYLICYYLGNVKVDFKPHFGYRIHGHNAIGAKVENDNLIQDMANFIARKNEQTSKEIKAFYSIFNDDISPKDKILFDVYLSCKRSFVSKWKILFGKSFGPKEYSLREIIAHSIRVVTNKL